MDRLIDSLECDFMMAHTIAEEDKNRSIFGSIDRVETYSSIGGTTPAEGYLFDKYVEPGKAVLDLGVGAGRTYPALAANAQRYVGIDYSDVMVAAAKENHPNGDFRVGDAADLSQFADESFDAVIFSYNGLDYISPESRRHATLAEIRRVLRPGGVLIFSTHNPRAVVQLRSVSGASRLKSLLVSLIGTARSVIRMVPTKTFWKGHGYSHDHVTGLATYYAVPSVLREHLSTHGLNAVEMIGGDHPADLRQAVSPWTYVAAIASAGELVSTETIRGDLPEKIALRWDELADELAVPPFMTRHWVNAWERVLAPDAQRSTVLARRPSGEIVGILPLAHVSRFLHSRVKLPLRYWSIAGAGVGAGDHMGPICKELDVAAALFLAAQHELGASSLLLENLDSRWTDLAQTTLSARRVARTECMAATRPDGGSFEQAWAKKARKNIRRNQRRVSEAGVSYRWIGPGSDFRSGLEILRRLHLARWESQGRNGLFNETRFEFLLELASHPSNSLTPWVLLMEKDSKAIAAMLVFVGVDRMSIYKTGWDPAFHRLSPGIALGAEAMRQAEEWDLHTVDYLRGPRGHKVELGCDPVVDSTLLSQRGFAGLLLMMRERLSSDGVRSKSWAWAWDTVTRSR